MLATRTDRQGRIGGGYMITGVLDTESTLRFVPCAHSPWAGHVPRVGCSRGWRPRPTSSSGNLSSRAPPFSFVGVQGSTNPTLPTPPSTPPRLDCHQSSVTFTVCCRRYPTTLRMRPPRTSSCSTTARQSDSNEEELISQSNSPYLAASEHHIRRN